MTRTEQELLFTKHLGIVKHLAKSNKFIPSACTGYDDLYQSGCEGLWKAVLAYNPTKNNKFSTFAWYVIKNHLHSYYKDRTCRYLNMPAFSTSLDRSVKSPDSPKNIPFIKLFENKIQSNRDKHNKQTMDVMRLINTCKPEDQELLINIFIKGYRYYEIPKLSSYPSIRKLGKDRVFKYIKNLLKDIEILYERDKRRIHNGF